jgi:hypothetical protein
MTSRSNERAAGKGGIQALFHAGLCSAPPPYLFPWTLTKHLDAATRPKTTPISKSQVKTRRLAFCFTLCMIGGAPLMRNVSRHRAPP